MLDGYPLRKYDWKDWLFMILTSSLVLQIVAVFILSFSAELATDGITPEMLTKISIDGTVYGTIISLPITLLVVYWLKIPLFNRKQVGKRKSFILRGLTKEDWSFLVKYIPVSYLLYLLGNIVVVFLFGEAEAANQVAIESLFGYVPVWVMFVMIVIVAPIAEELLFRGLILFPGNRLDTTWTRTIISAILFGVIHGPTHITTAYTYIGMGLIFSYAAKKTKTIEAAIVYHFLNNLLGFIAIIVIT